MSRPAANAYDLATRETMLDLWAQGTPTGEIADRVGAPLGNGGHQLYCPRS